MSALGQVLVARLAHVPLEHAHLRCEQLRVDSPGHTAQAWREGCQVEQKGCQDGCRVGRWAALPVRLNNNLGSES